MKGIVQALAIGVLVVLACLLVVSHDALSSTPQVLYVAPEPQGSGNCAGWNNACSLHTALELAKEGDEIWVRQGVYYPGGGSDKQATFRLNSGVSIYGGFAGTEQSRDERNWQLYPTILSGDIDRNDVNDDGNSIAETWEHIQGENAYHVVSATNVVSAVLDGLFITAGQANGSYENNEDRGGGMFVAASSTLTVTNVAFRGCLAEMGGGIYADSSTLTLTNASFIGMSATLAGGGMYQLNGVSTLKNTVFSNNAAGWSGGGLASSGIVRIENVLVTNNSARYGGGISGGGDLVLIENASIISNSAEYSGGGIYGGSGLVLIANTVISGNRAPSGGGFLGIGSPYGLELTAVLTNVALNANSADAGGGVFASQINAILTNVVFYSNTAKYGGGGVYSSWSAITMTDVVFDNNQSGSYGGGGVWAHQGSSLLLVNSTFKNNGSVHGGGIRCAGPHMPSTQTLVNVVFDSNSALWDGGGLVNSRLCRTVLTNATFSRNSAGLQGGGITSYWPLTITNSILWGNSAKESPEIFSSNALSSAISYSNIRGCGESGENWNPSCGIDRGGNIDTDPLFACLPAGNLRLRLQSPSVDAGDNRAVPPELLVDRDGKPRLVDIVDTPDKGYGTPPLVDMGAYEAQVGETFSCHSIYLPLVLKGGK